MKICCPKKCQTKKRKIGKTLDQSKRDDAYFSTSFVSFAPTFWLMIIDAPVTIEKQTDIEAHIGVETFPSELRYNSFTCPRNALSMSI